ncbi:hypothetical protein BpHYR1_029557 [Brachionus plicatilis]|uniref:Uncharacterized protein n=1 Tax=Brachionus plicatilis TaxID=10195 RepID=A0A3M7S3R2_BRAPC|nr:hypothetical protein BpHYR1_029557 [Brachionus plicatilis]
MESSSESDSDDSLTRVQKVQIFFNIKLKGWIVFNNCFHLFIKLNKKIKQQKNLLAEKRQNRKKKSQNQKIKFHSRKIF